MSTRVARLCGDAVPGPWGLTGRQAQAFADLLQILQSGEQSAALTFEVLGRRRKRSGDNDTLTAALSSVAADEREHAVLLARVQSTLPAPLADEHLQAATERFFSQLVSRTAGVHFTRIAALDSALCLVLAALRRAQPALFGAAFQRILTDEARHVALASQYARTLAQGRERECVAAATRSELSQLLALRADCFEELAIDPQILFRRIRQPPHFLRA